MIYDCLDCAVLNQDYEGAPLLCNRHARESAKLQKKREKMKHPVVGSHGLIRKDTMGPDGYVKEP